MDLVLEAAAATGTIAEINSSPDRLDLNDFMVKRAKDMGIKVAINTMPTTQRRDGHEIWGMGNKARLAYGKKYHKHIAP